MISRSEIFKNSPLILKSIRQLEEREGARSKSLNHQGQLRAFKVRGSKMTQHFRCGEDYTHIFLNLADVRRCQRKHGGRIYICEFKPGRPATDQDWRPITVRWGADMIPQNTASRFSEKITIGYDLKINQLSFPSGFVFSILWCTILSRC